MEEVQRVLTELQQELAGTMNKLTALKDHPVAGLAARNLAIAFTHLEDADSRLGRAIKDVGGNVSQEQPANPPATPTQPATPATPAADQNTAQTQPEQPAQPLAPADPNNTANTGDNQPSQ